jgi:hypothetical protein
MWHVRTEIAPAILLVVDFGGWYRLDSKSSRNSSHMIQHTQVSLLKDVIVPYTHLLPTLKAYQRIKVVPPFYIPRVQGKDIWFVPILSHHLEVPARCLFDIVYLQSS